MNSTYFASVKTLFYSGQTRVETFNTLDQAIEHALAVSGRRSFKDGKIVDICIYDDGKMVNVIQGGFPCQSKRIG